MALVRKFQNGGSTSPEEKKKFTYGTLEYDLNSFLDALQSSIDDYNFQYSQSHANAAKFIEGIKEGEITRNTDGTWKLTGNSRSLANVFNKGELNGVGWGYETYTGTKDKSHRRPWTSKGTKQQREKDDMLGEVGKWAASVLGGMKTLKGEEPAEPTALDAYRREPTAQNLGKYLMSEFEKRGFDPSSFTTLEGARTYLGNTISSIINENFYKTQFGNQTGQALWKQVSPLINTVSAADWLSDNDPNNEINALNQLGLGQLRNYLYRDSSASTDSKSVEEIKVDPFDTWWNSLTTPSNLLQYPKRDFTIEAPPGIDNNNFLASIYQNNIQNFLPGANNPFEVGTNQITIEQFIDVIHKILEIDKKDRPAYLNSLGIVPVMTGNPAIEGDEVYALLQTYAPDTNTVYVYDQGTQMLNQVPINDSRLANSFKSAFKNWLETKNPSMLDRLPWYVSSHSAGGTLQKFQQAGKIVSIYSNDQLAKAMQKETKAQVKTQQAQSLGSLKEVWNHMDPYNKARVMRMGTELGFNLGSLAAGPYGSAVSLGAGLGADIMNLATDISDPNVSAGKAAGNFGLGLLFDAASVAPYVGQYGKVGKFRKLLKATPYIAGLLATSMAVANIDGFQETGSKLLNKEDLNTDDLMRCAQALHFLTNAGVWGSNKVRQSHYGTSQPTGNYTVKLNNGQVAIITRAQLDHLHDLSRGFTSRKTDIIKAQNDYLKQVGILKGDKVFLDMPIVRTPLQRKIKGGTQAESQYGGQSYYSHYDNEVGRFNPLAGNKKWYSNTSLSRWGQGQPQLNTRVSDLERSTIISPAVVLGSPEFKNLKKLENFNVRDYFDSRGISTPLPQEIITVQDIVKKNFKRPSRRSKQSTASTQHVTTTTTPAAGAVPAPTSAPTPAAVDPTTGQLLLFSKGGSMDFAKRVVQITFLQTGGSLTEGLTAESSDSIDWDYSSYIGGDGGRAFIAQDSRTAGHYTGKTTYPSRESFTSKDSYYHWFNQQLIKDFDDGKPSELQEKWMRAYDRAKQGIKNQFTFYKNGYLSNQALNKIKEYSQKGPVSIGHNVFKRNRYFIRNGDTVNWVQKPDNSYSIRSAEYDASWEDPYSDFTNYYEVTKKDSDSSSKKSSEGDATLQPQQNNQDDNLSKKNIGVHWGDIMDASRVSWLNSLNSRYSRQFIRSMRPVMKDWAGKYGMVEGNQFAIAEADSQAGRLNSQASRRNYADASLQLASQLAGTDAGGKYQMEAASKNAERFYTTRQNVENYNNENRATEVSTANENRERVQANNLAKAQLRYNYRMRNAENWNKQLGAWATQVRNQEVHRRQAELDASNSALMAQYDAAQQEYHDAVKENNSEKQQRALKKMEDINQQRYRNQLIFRSGDPGIFGYRRVRSAKSGLKTSRQSDESKEHIARWKDHNKSVENSKKELHKNLRRSEQEFNKNLRLASRGVMTLVKKALGI